jgi:enoyl-CoA hydratase/carnithine racemase
MSGGRDLAPVPGPAARTDTAVQAAPPGPEALLRVVDGIACIELARPARGNALSAAMVETLLAALERAFDDRGVHTLLLTAAGRHFCTGFDLGDLEHATDGDLVLRFARIEALLDAVWRAPIRTAAIAPGRTWGAGADLFAACDLRLAAPDASFRFPGAGFGLVLGTRRLAERVGTDRARAWIADGATIDANAATAAGLASGIAALPATVADDGDAARAAAWREAIGPAPAIDRGTLAAIRAASRPAGGPGADALADADLAALVRSAARPGLKARILAYRDSAQRRGGAPER